MYGRNPVLLRSGEVIEFARGYRYQGEIFPATHSGTVEKTQALKPESRSSNLDHLLTDYMALDKLRHVFEHQFFQQQEWLIVTACLLCETQVSPHNYRMQALCELKFCRLIHFHEQ